MGSEDVYAALLDRVDGGLNVEKWEGYINVEIRGDDQCRRKVCGS